ncbi:MAG: HNH endonuclease [Fimbriimonadia bacterium]|jgi:5-methylcytosine-specific restriction endonuclease McrA
MAAGEVLLLNNDYEPLNVCTTIRALTLVMLGKAEVAHHADRQLHTVAGPVTVPSVLRMRYHVRRPLPQLKLCRQTVLARDNHTCQYCGRPSRDLTIDHVIPRRMGGTHTWENLVACCRRCNLKKGDKLLPLTNMKLVRQPRRPRYTPYISLANYLRAQQNELWRNYLPAFEDFAIEA